MNKCNSSYSISNTYLTCTISECGAQITSLKSTTDEHEYIWQAESSIWDGSAPILFPIVGRLKEGSYTIGNKKYSLPTHGFISSQTFKVMQQTESSITLRVNANKLTLESYPFDFQFEVTFSLVNKQLSVKYNIKNLDDNTLYFGIGSHPAFSLPITKFNEKKCKLLFSCQENQYCQLIKNDLLSEEKTAVAFEDKTLTLTPSLFDRDALIFRDIRSSSISLLIDDNPLLSLEVGNNKHLGLWAKPNAPYICIEPWSATDESIKTPSELKEKSDMTRLPSGEIYSNYYRINIL